MRVPICFVVCGAGLLAACAEVAATGLLPQIAVPATLLETADIRLEDDGRCVTGTIVAPAVTETITQQVEVIPAELDATGAVTRPAVFRNQQVERIVTPAQRDTFETLCPPAFTPNFTASLQRALMARDAYAGPINGIYDARTGEAVRLFQNTNGPNSQIIARTTAQDLGLVALSSGQLDTLDLPQDPAPLDL